MAAQDEGRVPLDKLPLADLKTWIEDWLQLNAATNIIQQIGGGGGTVITNISTSDLGIQRNSGLVVPTGKFGFVADTPADPDIVIFSRFVMPEAATATTVKVGTKQVPTGTSKLDVGIYDTDGSTLLTSTGAVAHSGTGWPEYTFTSPIDLDEGHEYVLAFLNDIDTGTWIYYGDSGWTEAFRNLYLTAVTVAQFMANSWQCRFTGTGWAALAANVAAAAGGAAHYTPPIATLQ